MERRKLVINSMAVGAVKTCRPSRQRSLVAQSILERYDHPTAEMVWQTARQVDPKISLATVYRHLERMADEGRINKFAVGDEADHYEPNVVDHIHARCINCGRIFDITSRLPVRISVKVQQEIGFQPQNCQVMVEGICKKCKAKEE
jgi:Fur family peroxide stress response transcriptional regulator